MNEAVVLIGGTLLFFGILIFTMLRENKKRRIKFRKKLAAMWGQFPDREYTKEELDRISHYAKRQEEEGFRIDAITWNDLDMDRIFMLLNQTISSPGEDYLYYLLQKPEFKKETLEERNRLMEYFHSHQEERRAIQEMLGNIGRLPDTTLSDAVHVLADIKLPNKRKHILMAMMALTSIVSFMIVPRYGIFIMIAVSCFNIFQYMKHKDRVDPYLTCFQEVLKMLAAADKLERCKMPGIAAYLNEISVYKKELSKFRKGSHLVVNRGGVTGRLEDLLMDYIRMILHIDLIKFNDMVTEMKKHQSAVDGLLKNYGILDSMISVASFREALPYYTLPDFTSADTKDTAVMEVTNVYHPLLQEPVANSIHAAGGTLLTGSNASGKSTFLKNIAINSILAQTIFTCTATAYNAPFLKIMTSMALKDDLQGGESYYIVEIKSLNRILEEAKKKEPLLCVIDEVLRGTNTIERIAASSRILAALDQKHILTFAATHDIELTYILEDIYTNYHFEEEVKEQDVVFNYLLESGRATTRNAIRLLDMIGYDKQIVEDSKKAAEEFEESGVWNFI